MARRTRKRTRRTRKITRRTRKRTNRNRRTYRRKSKTNQKRRVGGKTRNIRKSIKGGGVGKGLQEAVVGATRALKSLLKEIPTDEDLLRLMKLPPRKILDELKEFGLEYDKILTRAEINLIGKMRDYFKKMPEEELIRLGLILGEQGVPGLLQDRTIQNFLSQNSRASSVIITNSPKRRTPADSSSERRVMVGGAGSGSTALVEVAVGAGGGPVLALLLFCVVCACCVSTAAPCTAVAATADAIREYRRGRAEAAARARYRVERDQQEIDNAARRLAEQPEGVTQFRLNQEAAARTAEARQSINEEIAKYHDERKTKIIITVNGPGAGDSKRCEVSTMHTVRELGDKADPSCIWSQNSQLFKTTDDGENVAMVMGERLGKYDLKTDDTVLRIRSEGPVEEEEEDVCAICLRVIDPPDDAPALEPEPEPDPAEVEEDDGVMDPVPARHCITTTCRHSYCRRCITPWVADKSNCPLCKRVLTAESLGRYTRADDSSMMMIAKNPVGSSEWMEAEAGQKWKRAEIALFRKLEAEGEAVQLRWWWNHPVLLTSPHLIPEIDRFQRQALAEAEPAEEDEGRDVETGQSRP